MGRWQANFGAPPDAPRRFTIAADNPLPSESTEERTLAG
jgi:hypothetical protein